MSSPEDIHRAIGRLEAKVDILYYDVIAADFIFGVLVPEIS